MKFLRFRIAIRSQFAIVQIVNTVISTEVVVPTTVTAGRQMRPHTAHAGSAQGTSDVSMTEAAEVSALNPAQSAHTSAKVSDMTPAETSNVTSTEASEMGSAKASQVAAATKASPARRCLCTHETADQCCCDQENYHSS